MYYTLVRLSRTMTTDYAQLLFFFLIIVPSSILHEYMHGWVANQLGDPTAKYAGRLTLNPFAHIDLWGTILLPVLLFISSGGTFLFAYAKPVPYNPYNLKYQRWGPALVGVAGPLANVLLAVVFGWLGRYYPNNLAIVYIVYANVLLAIFNLVPIPPLDGSKLLFALLPRSLTYVQEFLERWGILLLFVFIFTLFQYVVPLIERITGVLLGA